MTHTHQQSSGSGRGMFWGLLAGALLICVVMWTIHDIEKRERQKDRYDAKFNRSMDRVERMDREREQESRKYYD